MFDAFGAHQNVAERAHPGAVAAHDENFEAVIVIEVDVERRHDEIGVIVLQIGEQALQRRLVMIEKQGDRARDFAADFALMFDQLSANHVRKSQRAIGVALLRDHDIEFARQSAR